MSTMTTALSGAPQKAQSRVKPKPQFSVVQGNGRKEGDVISAPFVEGPRFWTHVRGQERIQYLVNPECPRMPRHDGQIWIAKITQVTTPMGEGGVLYIYVDLISEVDSD